MRRYFPLILAILLAASGFTALPVTTAEADVNPGVLIRNLVVHNTDPTLVTNDTAGDSETSIAVNPADPNEIAITAFSGGWGATTPIWHSTDGGLTWTRQPTIPEPPRPATANGCPCDQTIDFDRDGTLFGSFLSCDGPCNSPTSVDVLTGSSDDLTDANAWEWFVPPGQTLAQNTNVGTSDGTASADQNWLIVNRDPSTASQDNVYVAYNDFDQSPTDMRVAVSYGNEPPNFTVDQSAGNTDIDANPGLRMNGDQNNGTMYLAYQRGTKSDTQYFLNRSTDGGATWQLNGNSAGFQVANGPTRQAGDETERFGSVNQLLGGTEHLAVDPSNGDVYYVYGKSADSNPDGVDGTNGNVLFLRRITFLPLTGTAVAGPERTIWAPTDPGAPQDNAALPSVAVLDNGTIGVQFHTADGFDADGFPRFSVRLARSTDQGQSWDLTLLQDFTSPVKNDGNSTSRQRLLGDYHQLKAVGNTFYGAYTASGDDFGHNTPNSAVEMDPYFWTLTSGPNIAVSGDLDFGTVPRGTTETREVSIFNTGDDALVITSVEFDDTSDSEFSVDANPGTPQTLQPGSHIDYVTRFSPPDGSDGGSRSGTLRIESTDPNTPVTTLDATAEVGVPDFLAVSASEVDFGGVPVDDRTNPSTSERTITLFNQASCDLCDLTVTDAALTGANVDDFEVVSPTFPQPIGAGNHLDVILRHDPSNEGLREAVITFSTDDPESPVVDVDLQGNGLLPAIGALPAALQFGPTVVTPSCGVDCGTTLSSLVSNFGQAELIVDEVSFLGSAAFSGPGATLPPTRLVPNGSYNQSVTFLPDQAARRVDGVVRIVDTIGSDPPEVIREIPLCGEAVGRGIRVLVLDANGDPVPELDQVRLTSHGVIPNENVREKNVGLTTLSPPETCQTIQFQYENQALAATQQGASQGSYYQLTVKAGMAQASQSFTLDANEFKSLVLTLN